MAGPTRSRPLNNCSRSMPKPWRRGCERGGRIVQLSGPDYSLVVLCSPGAWTDRMVTEIQHRMARFSVRQRSGAALDSRDADRGADSSRSDRRGRARNGDLHACGSRVSASVLHRKGWRARWVGFPTVRSPQRICARSATPWTSWEPVKCSATRPPSCAATLLRRHGLGAGRNRRSELAVHRWAIDSGRAADQAETRDSEGPALLLDRGRQEPVYEACNIQRPDSGRVVMAALIFFSQRMEGVCFTSTLPTSAQHLLQCLQRRLRRTLLRPASRPSRRERS